MEFKEEEKRKRRLEVHRFLITSQTLTPAEKAPVP